MSHGAEYGRRARRHMGGVHGTVIKCKLCGGPWLFGKQRLIGICGRCAKIAVERNNAQILARGVEGVVSTGWSQNEWPGRMKVAFKVYGQRREIEIAHEQIALFKGDITDWVRREIAEAGAELARLPQGLPVMCTECGIYMEFYPEEVGDRDTPGMPAEWQCTECGASAPVEWDQ